MVHPKDHEQINWLAKTIYGEARGENIETMLAVAWVIRNRVNGPDWMGNDYRSVVLKPYQFSCWNEGDPNRKKCENPQGDIWHVCLGIAQAVYFAPKRLNPIPGVLHYFDVSLNHKPPKWAQEGEEIQIPGVTRLRLFRGVA